MRNFITKLKNISENPYLNIIIAFLALCSGIFEFIYELQESKSFRLGAHHGIILFAILHILRTVPHLYESLMKIDEMVNNGVDDEINDDLSDQTGPNDQ